MPGFFGLFDFTKPGKGVEKDAPKKAAFIVFFELLGRKAWTLTKLNFMFLLFNLPALVIAFFLTYIFIPDLSVLLETEIVADQHAAIGVVYIRAIIGLLFCVVPVITVGPFQCGFSYIIRNIIREEPSFLWGDFIEHTKNNWKQALAVTLIDIVVFSIILYALSFYYSQESSMGSFLFGIVIVGLGIFLMMHLFMYTMLVTFNVTLKQLYSNCFKFAMIKFIPNALILLLCFAITLLPFLIPSVGFSLGIVLLLLFTFSFNGYIINFYAYPLMKKYMLDKPPVGAAEDQPGEESSDDTDKQERQD
ncbi:MAG: DUF624 domain-containing protein [Clostridia bacterium]|jgi:uncharacterized membrane protein YesL|nr:DUF624 domain-containing protein [Clostridiaceae bacterium]